MDGASPTSHVQAELLCWLGLGAVALLIWLIAHEDEDALTAGLRLPIAFALFLLAIELAAHFPIVCVAVWLLIPIASILAPLKKVRVGKSVAGLRSCITFGEIVLTLAIYILLLDAKNNLRLERVLFVILAVLTFLLGAVFSLITGICWSCEVDRRKEEEHKKLFGE